MKTAKNFWREKFEEFPQTDADKLAVAMMQEYANDAVNEILTKIAKTGNDLKEMGVFKIDVKGLNR